MVFLVTKRWQPQKRGAKTQPCIAMHLNENILTIKFIWPIGGVTLRLLHWCSTLEVRTWHIILLWSLMLQQKAQKENILLKRRHCCCAIAQCAFVLKEVPFASVMCEFSVVTFDFRCHRHFFYLELPRKGEAKGGYEEEKNRRMGFLSLIFIHPVKGLYKYIPIK